MARSRGSITPTRKHLARQARENLQRRYLMIGTGIVVVLVLALIIYGLANQYLLQPGKTVAQVDDTKITVRSFVNRTRYERYQLVNQWMNVYQTMQLFAGQSPDLELSFRNQMQQIQFQLDPQTIGRDVLNRMIDEILIRREADALGIAVSDEDVDRFIQDQLGFVSDDPVSTPTLFPTALATSTLSPPQLTIVPQTPTPTDSPTSTASSTPEITSTPTLIPSPTTVLSPTFTPTPYTEDAFIQDLSNIYETYRTETGLTEQELQDVIRYQLIRERMTAEIGKDVPLVQDQVWARHILVADETTARQVLDQLESGVDWNQLAAEFSTDTATASTGGDLGWFGQGMMFQEFEQAAFNLNTGQLSEPVQSPAGWHIIQLLGKEPRSLSETDYQQLLSTNFSDWLTTTRQAANIQTFDLWTEVVPTTPEIPVQLLQQ